MPDLRLPSRSPGITAFRPVPGYAAWWQMHTCVNNLPKVVPGSGTARTVNPVTSESRVHGPIHYTQGDSDVISMPAGFPRHLVGKTLINVLTVVALKYTLLAR